MSILSLHLFDLYLLHSLYTNRRGGRGGGSKHIFSCYLIFLPPCLYLYSLCIPMYVLSLSSVVTVFGKAGGKENIIFFHSMREGGGLWGKKVSAKYYISFYLSVYYVVVSLCLSMSVCPVFVWFRLIWFVGALSSKIDLVFTCSQSFCSSSKVKAPTNLSSVIVA